MSSGCSDPCARRASGGAQVKRFEAFNRQDFEALSIVYHPQAEFHAPTELAESGIVLPNSHGYDAWCEAIVEWLAVWDEYRQEPSEMIDLGDRLVILDELVGHGKGSGVPLRQEHAVLYIRENGKVLHQHEFFSHAEALEAVGLRE